MKSNLHHKQANANSKSSKSVIGKYEIRMLVAS